MGARFRLVFAGTPVFFFAVVIGVALTFRVAISAMREAPAADVAPTFVTTAAEPGLGLASASAGSEGAIGEVGAAGKVQPLGMPAPARVGPKPRGHGRKPPRLGASAPPAADR